MVGAFFYFTGRLNTCIDAIIMGCSILALIYFAAKYSLKTFTDEGGVYGTYLSVIYFIEIAIAGSAFLWLPSYLENVLQINKLASILRWAGILIFGFLYFKKLKHAEARGVISFTIHSLLLLASWLIDRWAGILFVALPLLVIYYHIAARVALSIMPFSNPEDKAEERKRIGVFISYLWGLQLPLWKTASMKAQEAEKRIDGAPSFIKKLNGLLWTHPHQIAGISNGPKFRADGPGLIFLAKGEQPFEIVDLRNRSGKSKIKAISKDGISLMAEVSIAFVLDSQIWTREMYQDLLRYNTMLRDGKDPNENLDGTFPYSQARARSALSYRSKKIMPEGEEQILRWEDHVLALAEEAAREVLSERSVEDLWKARENETGTAAEEITERIKALIKEPLQRCGITLLTAKASGFSSIDFDINGGKVDEVEEQNIATWSVEWERHRAITHANGQAESDRIQQEAYAYAHSALLTAIADGLKQTRALNPNLPRYVIAMRFISALEKMLEEQSVIDPEAQNSLLHIKQHLISDQKED